MNKRVAQIIAVGIVGVTIFGSGVWLAITSSPKYALYQMYHDAQINDKPGFLNYYKVYTSKTAYNQPDPPALETFKADYYQPLSLWNAMITTKALTEKITPDGIILIVNSQHPKVAYQMLKRDGNWIALSVAILK